MTDRPIIFSAPMVRALLAGRKTQTRRVIKSARVFASPGLDGFTLRGDHLARALQNADRFRCIGGDGWAWEADAYEWQAPAKRTNWMAHVGIAPGTRLWVREAWRTESDCYNDLAPADMSGEEAILYEADADWAGNKSVGRKRAGMHMPRWASRLTLIVTDVRVQRLQEISDEDAEAEGAPPQFRICIACPDGAPDYKMPVSHRAGFANVWSDINGSGSWEANPRVAAYTFTVHKGNIDQMPAIAG